MTVLTLAVKISETEVLQCNSSYALFFSILPHKYTKNMYFPLRTQMHLYANTQNFMLSCQKLTRTSSQSLPFHSHSSIRLPLQSQAFSQCLSRNYA
jgi:hypothetical protein